MNLFSDYGYNSQEVENRIKETFHSIFEGPEDERIFFEDKDGGYILDTGNNDVRSEGCGYGMMIAVQMDRKDIFDKIWAWCRKHMYISEGNFKGYYHFACERDGKVKMEAPRPDGEEYFALSLFFASHRWGNGEGIFNYEAEAKAILDCALNSATPLWNRENYLVRNLVGSNESDISYNLPHYYELFSMFDVSEHNDFWLKTAGASRAFIVKTANKKTGMSAEYVTAEGNPLPLDKKGSFFSHSYVSAMNIGLYTLWFGDVPEYAIIARNLISFFDGKDVSDFMDYKVDGTVLERKALHPVALSAGLGAVAMALERSREEHDEQVRSKAERSVRRFWNTSLRKDERRYYDNCIYMLCLLALSGTYKVY